ncbi:hypothetical protein [Leisingera sp. McT4-56]|uniref:hypothetical protein n=1 Tax=Leisingera sp. McT4-56 TaxID=2881255 RepID=UPI001CF8794D|nr:hypothetical protein [Leisingera sp. McT4-56]MCB4455514.1 hypothetical protein [Leisingera sp. McT4-56]
MNINRRSAALAFCGAAILSLPNAAFAAQPVQKYLCDIRTYGQGGWVPEETLLTFLDDGKTVEVLDPFIWHVEREAVVTSYKALKNGKKRFSWDMTLPAQSGVKYQATYRIDFTEADLSGRIKANISGIRNGRMGGLLKCRKEPE